MAIENEEFTRDERGDWDGLFAAMTGEAAPTTETNNTKKEEEPLQIKATVRRKENTQVENQLALKLDKQTVDKLLSAKSRSRKNTIIRNAIDEENSFRNKTAEVEKDDEVEATIEEGNTLLKKLEEEKKQIESIKNVLNYNIPSFEDDMVVSTDELPKEDDVAKHNVNVTIDPNTGEHKITSLEESTEDEKDFNDIVDKINNNEDYFSNTISESDIEEYATSGHSILNDIGNDIALQPETYTELLNIIERKNNNENFNVYKACPAEVKQMIDNYIGSTPATKMATKEINRFKNQIADALISDFVNNIRLNKAKNDFAKELDSLYKSSTNPGKEFDSIEECNVAYREMSSKIEDEAKRSRMNEILDQIDKALYLDELKEFAKKCKIKKIEIEKYQSRVFNGFLSKYKESNNYIYDINMATAVLSRYLISLNYTFDDAIKFMIAFCKFVQNYSPDNPLEHAYMYYVVYYCASLDMYKNEKFLNNVTEIVDILNNK